MKLITTSFPMNVFSGKPAWIDFLKEDECLKSNDFTVYDPTYSLFDNTKNKNVVDVLKQPVTLHGSIDTFDNVGRNFCEVEDRLVKSNETLYSSEIEFQSTYIIARSSVFIIDLNEPSYGRSIVELCYANCLGIPVIGILHKCIIDPFVQNRINVIVTVNKIDDIVRQVLSLTLLNQMVDKK